MLKSQNSTAARGGATVKQAAYGLDDLQCELILLWQLLDVATDTIQNCDFGPADNRVPHLDRLHALLQLGLEKLASVNDTIEANYDAIGTSAVRGAA